jgi:hypothetical protein
LIADKLLVRLKIIEADNVVRVRRLVNVADIRFVDSLLLRIEDKFGCARILRLGAHRIDIFDVEVASAISVAGPP